MKELTDKSFSDALFDCYTTPNTRILIAFGMYKQMHDFAYSLRETKIRDAEVTLTTNFELFQDELNIRFKNGSSIRAIYFSDTPVYGGMCDQMLLSYDLCQDEVALARLARYERSEAYKIRKGLSYKPVVAYKEEPTEPDTEALDAFLSEFSIVKS